MDQNNCIEFCVKIGIEGFKSLEILTVAYGESTLNKKKKLQKN